MLQCVHCSMYTQTHMCIVFHFSTFTKIEWYIQLSKKLWFFHFLQYILLSPKIAFFSHFFLILLLFFHYLSCSILWFEFISRLHYLYMYLDSYILHTYSVGTLFFIHSSYNKIARMCCMILHINITKHWMNEQIVVHKISFRLRSDNNSMNGEWFLIWNSSQSLQYAINCLNYQTIFVLTIIKSILKLIQMFRVTLWIKIV